MGSNGGERPADHDQVTPIKPRKHHQSSRHHADVVATFGSCITCRQNSDNDGNVSRNRIHLALYDFSPMARDDVKCKH